MAAKEIVTWADFGRAMSDLRPADQSFKMVAKRAAKQGKLVSTTTVFNIAKGKRIPRLESVEAYLAGCGLESDEAQHWLELYNKLAKRDDEPVRNRGVWLFRGTDADDHFDRRARGKTNQQRGGGDLFRGRVNAVLALRSWLTSPQSQGEPLVITGQPGAGKSAVLSRVALQLAGEGRCVGLAMHLHGATHQEVLNAVGELVGILPVRSTDELLVTVERAERPEGTLALMFDALDEVATVADRRRIVALLSDLAALRRVRVAVTTRALASGSRYGPDSLLPALGVRDAGAENLVDLDDDAYFAIEDLEQFGEAVLVQHDAKPPVPRTGAWTRYRAQPRAARALAAVIAARARPNFLVAALAAVAISTSREFLDPASPSFDSGRIPSTVGEALTKFLDTLADTRRAQVRVLLSALAYGRGEGLDDGTWMAFAAALELPTSGAHLDELRDSPAADYLIETVRGMREPVTRLFHQALTDELLARRRSPASDERQLVAALRPVGGWGDASSYARRFAVDHAHAAGVVNELMRDPVFLSHAELSRLLSVGIDPLDGPAREMLAVLRRSAFRAVALSPRDRARLAALVACHLGLPEAQRLFQSAGHGWFRPWWAHLTDAGKRELVGSQQPMTAIAVGNGEASHIAAGYEDGTVRVWDGVTGAPRGEPYLATRAGAVRAMVILPGPDEDILFTGGDDHSIRMRAIGGDDPGDRILDGHTGPVTAMCAARLDGREVVATGSDDGMIWIWDPVHRRAIGGPLAAHRGGVSCLSAGRLLDGDTVVSAGADGDVAVWNLATRQRVAQRSLKNPSTALAVCHRDGHELVGIGERSGRMAIWNVRADTLVAAHRLYDRIRTVEVGTSDGRPVFLAAAAWGGVKAYDATTGKLRSGPSLNAGGGMFRVGSAAGRDLVVAPGPSGVVRVADMDHPERLGDPQEGHRETVLALASGAIGGDPAVVSAGADQTIGVWRATTGKPFGDLIHLRDKPELVAVTLGAFEGQDVIAAASHDRVTVWNAVTRAETGPVDRIGTALTLSGHGLVIGDVAGEISVWNPLSLTSMGLRLAAHDGPVRALLVDDRDRMLLISGGDDHALHVWDLELRRAVASRPVAHDGPVRGIALGEIQGRRVVASAGEDHMIRLWDPSDLRPVGRSISCPDAKLTAIGLLDIDGRAVIASTGLNRTVRLHDAHTGQQLDVIHLLDAGLALVTTAIPGAFVVAVGDAVCSLRVQKPHPDACSGRANSS